MLESMANRGDNQVLDGKFEEAVAAYTQAMDEVRHGDCKKRSSKLAEARLYLHRSVAFRQLRRYREAEEDAVKSVDLHPEHANAYCNWAVCLKLLGKRADASRACDVGLERFPRNSALRRLRSEVLLNQNTETFESDIPQNMVSDSPAMTQIDPETARDRLEIAADHTVAGLPADTLKIDDNHGATVDLSVGERPVHICGAHSNIVSDPLQQEPRKLLRKRMLQNCTGGDKEIGEGRRDKWKQADEHDCWAKRSRRLRRSKFARKMSLWWRLCRSDIPSTSAQLLVASQRQAVRRPFTPLVLNMDRCNARTWAGGRGGQCTKAKFGDSDFCRSHGKDAKWKRHGRVDGPIPISKLREFMRASTGGVETSDAKPALFARRSAHCKSHVGNHVRVRQVQEQDEDRVGASCVGMVVSEDVAKESVLVLVPPPRESWRKVCVQRKNCVFLREESMLDVSTYGWKRPRVVDQELAKHPKISM